MTREEFKIIMSSEVGKALPDINSVGKSLSDLSKNADGAAKSLGMTGNAADKTAGAFDNLNKSLSSIATTSRRIPGDFVRVDKVWNDLNNTIGGKGLLMHLNQGKLAILGYRNASQSAAPYINRLSRAQQELSRMSVNANGALVGFTNILRDAPYGIQGIGNNIFQLSDAFGQMVRQSGSARAALGGLFKSILSPAGLIQIGLSAAISLWTVYSQRQQRAAAAAKEAADALKSANDIIKETSISLRETNAAAAVEVSTLNKLFEIAGDDTRSRQDRISALKELRKQTNGYLDSLTLETVKTNEARAALDEFNKSLFASSLIKAYQGQVDELAKSYVFNREQAEKGRKAIEDFDAALKRQRDRIASGQLTGSEIAEAQENVVKNEITRNKLVQDTNKFIKEQNRLYDLILGTGSKIAEIQVKVNPFQKAEEESKKAYKGFSDLNTIATQTIFTFSRFNQALGFGFGIDGLTTLSNDVVTEINKVDAALTGFQYTAQKRLNDMIKPVQETVKRVTIEYGSLITGAVEALGTAIGSGDLSDAFTSFANLFGGWLQNLGQQLIVYSGVLEGLQVAIASLNPAAAFAAGLLAIAAGAAIKGFASDVPSFATGGIANGPMLALIGDNPGRREAIVPSEDWREAFGGRAESINVTGEFTLQNDVLVAAVQRGLDNLNRTL